MVDCYYEVTSAFLVTRMLLGCSVWLLGGRQVVVRTFCVVTMRLLNGCWAGVFWMVNRRLPGGC